MNANSIRISLTNETVGHMFSDFREPSANYSDTPGDIYRSLQREYGRCTSKVYVDGADGTRQVGWYFESLQIYTDSRDTYLQGAWCSLEVIGETS